MKSSKIKLKIIADPGFGPNYILNVQSLITKDPQNADGYRITWFDRNLKPKGHFPLSEKDLTYIKQNKDLTEWLKIEFSRPLNCKPQNIKIKIDDIASLNEVKSVLLELIGEAVFGHRFKISLGGKIYPALVSENVAHNERHESEYRITWFEPATMQPYNHIDFGTETLNYILHHKKFPMGISIKYFKLGLPVPKIIAEMVTNNKNTPTLTGALILVGTIDPADNFVEAKFGGSHASLQCRTNRKGDFRYNEDTEIVYWHEDHPRFYEELVKEYILNKMHSKVIKHITLDRYRGNPIAYSLYYNDAHGAEQPEFHKP